MKNRTTPILLISILVLGSCIWLQEAWRAKMPSKQSRQLRLFNLDADTLVSVQFKYSNTIVNCTRESGEWMAGGSEFDLGRADEALIQRMVAGLNSMGKGTTITAENMETRGFDASEYGFNQPMLEIVAVDNKGSHNWQIGKKAALGDMVYARVADAEEIYTLPGKLLEIAPIRPDQLRDRTLFPSELSGVRRIEIRGPGGFIQISKDLQTGWHIQQPVSAPAELAAVERYLVKLLTLRIEEFVAENVSDFSVYGLQDERQLALGGVDGTSSMLILGDEITDNPGFIYARRADDTSVFSLKKSALDYLNASPDEFRNADVLSLASKDISLIVFSRGDDRLEMIRDEAGEWNVVNPVAWPAEKAAIAELLLIWKSGVVTDFNVPQSADTAEWTMMFGAEELQQTNVVSVLPLNGRKDGLLVRLGAEKALYQINLPMIPDAMIDPLHYKKREIWNFEKPDIQKVTLRKDGVEVRSIERKGDDGIVVTEAEGVVDQVDRKAVETLFDLLTEVRAMEYIALNPRDLGIFGLDAPVFELQIGLGDANELGRVLLIGRETPEGFYSMVKGRDVVFLLNKRFVELISEDLNAAEPVPPVE